MSTRFSLLSTTDQVIDDWKKRLGAEHFVQWITPDRWTNISQDINRERLRKIHQNYLQGENRTIVMIPSLSFNMEALKGITGIKHYETRSLWAVLMADCPKTRVIFLSSAPVDMEQIDNLLASHPNGINIKRRISFLSPADQTGDMCLTDRILADGNLLKKLGTMIDRESTYIEAFLTTGSERKLAEQLDIPFLGHGENQDYLMTKSANRKLFKKAGVRLADGVENIHSKRQLFAAFCKLIRENPTVKRMLLKLDMGVSGEGNAVLTLPEDFDSRSFITSSNYKKMTLFSRVLADMKPQSAVITSEDFVRQLPDGAVLEIFLEGKIKHSPSVQGEIGPGGELRIVSSHEQVLDENGMTFLGCEYPAAESYRSRIEVDAWKVGMILKSRGVVGRFGVDFLVADNGEPHAIEINLRQGGTTHPYEFASRLTGIGAEDGLYYVSSDNLKCEDFRVGGADRLIALAEKEGLAFSQSERKGVVFHLLSAARDVGKIGYIAIGNSSDEARVLSKKVQSLCKTLK